MDPLQQPAASEMDDYLAWLIAGFVLVIVELVSGSFYLLVLGIAAFAGAAVAYAKLGIAVQAITAAVVAVAGMGWVRKYRSRTKGEVMRSPDHGQPAPFETWIDRDARRARVKHRGVSWEAVVEGDVSGQPGEVLYVLAVDGNTLKVSKTRPA